METRKLQKTGGSTYIVSLPKHWVTSSKLKEGDPVSMVIDDNGLLVLDHNLGTSRPSSRVEVFVDDDANSVHFMRSLIGLYISGYDEIVVRARNRIPPEIRKAVRDFTRKVIGPEIVEESGIAITIQDVADHSHLDMRKILKRMHLMARSMHVDAIESMAEGNKDLAVDVVSRDDEVDRLYWFMAKQRSMMARDSAVARKIGVSLTEASFFVAASKALERIADHAARIAYSASELAGEKTPDKVISEIQAYSESVLLVLDRAVEALLKRDAKIANEVADETEKLRERRNSVIHQVMEQKGKYAVPLALVVESLERTALYSADLAETAINIGGPEKK